MSITTLDEIDQARLSADARETLNEIAPRIADGEETKEIAADLGMTPKQVNERLAGLREEMRAQKEGATLPPLKDEDYEALRDSIRDFGQLVPIIVDESNEPLYDDGNHRMRVCHELGLEPWLVQHPDLSVVNSVWRRGASLAVNTARRQLTPDQRRQVAASELLFDPHASDRSIAARTGVSHPTVAKVRRELQGRGLVESVSTRRRSDGHEGAHPAPLEDRDEAELHEEVIATESDRDIDLMNQGVIEFRVGSEFVDKLSDWYGPLQIRIVEIEGRGYELWVREL